MAAQCPTALIPNYTDHSLCRMQSPPQRAMTLESNRFCLSTAIHKWAKSLTGKHRSWPCRCFLRSLRSLFIRSWKKSHGGLTVNQMMPFPLLAFVVWIIYNKPVFRGRNRWLGWWINLKALSWLPLSRKYSKNMAITDLHIKIWDETRRGSPSWLVISSVW